MIERDHVLTTALAAAYRTVTGDDPRYGGGSWLADTASFGRLVPTVIFGPGHEPVYMPNEWLATDDIEVAAGCTPRRPRSCSAPDGGRG